MSFNHKSMHSQHKMMFKNYYITSNNQQKEHKFTQKILSLFPDDNNSRIRPMPEDSFCIQYKNCTGCPRATENTLVYKNLPKGEHIPKDKCTQNCMLFMLKGELLINSEEYPGNTLHEKQFILQAIGSKIEILALTDVEYITFWFNELPLLCEDRYNEIINDTATPEIYTPRKNSFPYQQYARLPQ